MSFVIVQHYYDIITLSLAEQQLAAAGIPTFVQDALTTQVSGLEARALGGAKLMVRKKDYNRAAALLRESGLLEDKDNRSGWFIIESLDQLASLLPQLAQQPKEIRLVCIVFVLLSLVLSIAFVLLLF